MLVRVGKISDLLVTQNGPDCCYRIEQSVMLNYDVAGCICRLSNLNMGTRLVVVVLLDGCTVELGQLLIAWLFWCNREAYKKILLAWVQ